MNLEQIERNRKLKFTILDLVRYHGEKYKCGEIDIEIIKDMFNRLAINLTEEEMLVLNDSQ